ncbi:MAG: DUF4386 domain-containing protein [Saprospiraceae bacterium]|nr:DUF4386 domain-containing protein [Saprospiraceae bacterium]
MNANELKKTARLTGIFYLLWIFTAFYSLVYVQSKTYVKGDAAATAANFLANEFIYRTGIVNGLIGSILWIFIVLLLYRMFVQVHKAQALLMVVLVLVQIPVFFIMNALDLTSLMLFKGEILKTFELYQRQDLSMFIIKINDYISIALEMFWGLWLFPFGYLVYQSGFIPRILGTFLILNGIAYVIHCLTHLIFPIYQDFVFKLSTPIWTLGEVSIMLWLVVKGANIHQKDLLEENKI